MPEYDILLEDQRRLLDAVLLGDLRRGAVGKQLPELRLHLVAQLLVAELEASSENHILKSGKSSKSP